MQLLRMRGGGGSVVIPNGAPKRAATLCFVYESRPWRLGTAGLGMEGILIDAPTILSKVVKRQPHELQALRRLVV